MALGPSSVFLPGPACVCWAREQLCIHPEVKKQESNHMQVRSVPACLLEFCCCFVRAAQGLGPQLCPWEMGVGAG